MIPKECKRLAEVDFPIAEVSKHAAREKSIRFGHPSTLHLWWARRPLAACRAMLMALLLPDPCDGACPEDFRNQARKLLSRTHGLSESADLALRKKLLTFIADFANWDRAADPTYLGVARALVRAAHPEETPLVVDPFAGGGSIPLEALRVGCEAFASDLNPVSCLILKVLLEDIPRRGPKLAEELRHVGEEIKKGVEKELAEFYPPDPDGATPIAYLWARTVRCERPNCGAEIPLVRSLWLCKKAARRRALRPKIVRKKGETPQVQFEIFEPQSEAEVQRGTVSRAKATCPCCNVTLLPERVRAQLATQRGGADVIFDNVGNRVAGAYLLAVVTLKEGEPNRQYRLPTTRDYGGVRKAASRLQKESTLRLPNGLGPIPDEPLPLMSGTFNVPLYGMTRWGDVFSERQKVVLTILLRALHKIAGNEREKTIFLALTLSRFTDIFNALCQWESSKNQVRHLFTRQAIPMLWDFAEPNPLGLQAGDFETTLGTMLRVAERPWSSPSGQSDVADAVKSPLPDVAASLWFTDPPYYFAVPYADLSDFFFVWLKRALPCPSLIADPFDSTNQLTPKRPELCEMAHWDQGRYAYKDQKFFESGMADAFAEGRRILRDDGIGCVVFAHKSTEGWEALLTGLTKGGWVITGSWPIATESANRLRARDSAALATSVHLVCRPRPEDAPTGDWQQAHRELPKRVGDWMEHLQNEGVRGADLVFACIGPALEIYSRYSKVVDAEDREIPLGGDPEAKEPYKRGFLAYVWEVVGRSALEQVLGTPEAQARNGGAGALEEDARLTALFLWTLQSTREDMSNGAEDGEAEDDPGGDDDQEAPSGRKKAGFTLIFDVVRRFAQPLGIHLDEWEGRIIETKKGVVRLLPVRERSKLLFGEAGVDLAAQRFEQAPVAGARQLDLFGELAMSESAVGAVPGVRGRGRKRAKAIADEELQTHREATTLDRVHAAMLLQAAGRANALRTMLKAEVERSPGFLRLANSLSALYPKDSEEKRLLDAMLLAAPR